MSLWIRRVKAAAVVIAAYAGAWGFCLLIESKYGFVTLQALLVGIMAISGFLLYKCTLEMLEFHEEDKR